MRGIKYITLLVALLISVTIRAQYNPDNPIEPGVLHKLSLTVTPSSGGYLNTDSGASFSAGTKIHLYAYSYSGYVFKGWKEDGVLLSTNNSYTYYMPERDASLVAEFEYSPKDPNEPDEPVVYKYAEVRLTASPEEGGYFNQDKVGKYKVGSTINLYAYAHSHYLFDKWTENGETISTSSSLNYYVKEGNHELVAHFIYDPKNPNEPVEPKLPHLLRKLIEPENAGYTNEDGKYKEGTSVYCYAHSHTNYSFKYWTVGNDTVSWCSSFDYIMPDSAVTMIAHFEYTPEDPNEPSKPDEACNFYGLGVNGKPGETVNYPIFLENHDNVYGAVVDVKFPQGFTVHKDNIITSGRITDQKLDVKELGNNDFRISLIGKQQFTGLNGILFKMPVTIPDTAQTDHKYQVDLSHGVIHSNDTVHTATPVKDGVIIVKRTIKYFTLNINLKKGWNWISSNINEPNYLFARDFAQPIEKAVERFMGYDSELIRDPKLGLNGNLGKMSPTEGYMVLTNVDVSGSWTGAAFFPEETVINIDKGWNWIGYVPTSERNLNEALKLLVPTEGDVIKDYNSFATYSNGTWTGTLKSMKPGTGYMYHSADSKMFKYSSNSETAKAKASLNEEEKNCPWNICRNVYPYNMSVIAETHIDGNVVDNETFIIGAFVDDECRGIGSYIEGRLFITVYGDINRCEEISFKAMDGKTMKEYEIEETITFGNKIEGSMNSPFIMTIGAPTAIDNIEDENKYDVFISTGNILYLTGNINKVRSVSVISSAGVTLAETTDYGTSGINISSFANGPYILMIRTENDILVKKFMKVN